MVASLRTRYSTSSLGMHRLQYRDWDSLSLPPCRIPIRTGCPERQPSPYNVVLGIGFQLRTSIPTTTPVARPRSVSFLGSTCQEVRRHLRDHASRSAAVALLSALFHPGGDDGMGSTLHFGDTTAIAYAETVYYIPGTWYRRFSFDHLRVWAKKRLTDHCVCNALGRLSRRTAAD